MKILILSSMTSLCLLFVGCSSKQDNTTSAPSSNATQHPTNDVKKITLQPGPQLGKDGL